MALSVRAYLTAAGGGRFPPPPQPLEWNGGKGHDHIQKLKYFMAMKS